MLDRVGNPNFGFPHEGSYLNKLSFSNHHRHRMNLYTTYHSPYAFQEKRSPVVETDFQTAGPLSRQSFLFMYIIEAPQRENQHFAYAKNKDVVSAQLISVFIFATRIIQFIYFYPKFKASSLCVGPCRKTKLLFFSCEDSFTFKSICSTCQLKRMIYTTYTHYKIHCTKNVNEPYNNGLVSCTTKTRGPNAHIFWCERVQKHTTRLYLKQRRTAICM